MISKKFACSIGKLKLTIEFNYEAEEDVKGRITTVDENGILVSAISFKGDCTNNRMFVDDYYPDPPEIKPFECMLGTPWLIQNGDSNETLTIKTIVEMPGYQEFNGYVLESIKDH